MPTSRGRKKSPKGSRTTPNTSRDSRSGSQHWSRIQKFWAVGVAALGVAASIVAFWPRVSIDVQQPFDDSNPLSSPVEVTNGFPALENVNLALGLCSLQITEKFILRGRNSDCSGGTGVFLQPPTMTDHSLSIDDKWEVFFGDFLDPNGWRQASGFNGGDVTFKLTFTPWPLSIVYRGALITREYRWIAVKVGEKWRWVPKTIDKDYQGPRRAFSERFKVRK